MQASLALIANPAANGGCGLSLAEQLAVELKRRRAAVELLVTERGGDAGRLAGLAIARGAPAVVACGGDGTVQEVARVAAELGGRLALAPTGRCNDFARALGASDRVEAIAAGLLSGRTRAVDLANADGVRYCTVGAVGFDAAVSRFVDEAALPFKGTVAYLYGVLRVLPGYRPAVYRLAWDGGSYHGPLLMIAVANTPTYGNGIPMVPGARADDGMLKVCLVKPVGLLRVCRLLPTVLGGRHGGLPEVSFLETGAISIESDEPVELWADGEAVGGTPVRIRSEAEALTLVDTWGDRPGPALAGAAGGTPSLDSRAPKDYQ